MVYVGTLYCEFQYVTPPPAYSSLSDDHVTRRQPPLQQQQQQQQHQLITNSTTTTTITTTTSSTSRPTGDPVWGVYSSDRSVLDSNPPSYHSQLSTDTRTRYLHGSTGDATGGIDGQRPPEYLLAAATGGGSGLASLGHCQTPNTH